MGHSYNNGLHTTSKGFTVDAVRITGLNVATQTIAEDCKSGLIAGCTKGVTGVYVLQLSRPYPPKIVICQPTLSNADGVTDLRFATYDTGGYNATAGTITIRVSDDDDNGAPVLADGSATDELHVLMMFNRYTN
jgi:hypothetical protein